MNDLNPIDAGQGDLTNGQPTSDLHDVVTPSTPTTPSAAQSAAEQLYEVKIGGQSRKVPLNELLSGYSRQQDYTAKTMALAEERRTLEARVESERQQVREYLSRPENVKQLLAYLESQNPATANPNQPLTPQHLQAAIEAERARQGQMQQQMLDELEQRQTAASYRNEIDTHIKGILETHPQLKAIRGIDRILKQAALEQQPTELGEAKTYIAQAAQEQLDAIMSQFTVQQKQAALAKNNLTQKGTEPPGGAPPMPAAVKSTARIGSPEFNELVAKRLEAFTTGAR